MEALFYGALCDFHSHFMPICNLNLDFLTNQLDKYIFFKVIVSNKEMLGNTIFVY